MKAKKINIEETSKMRRWFQRFAFNFRSSNHFNSTTYQNQLHENCKNDISIKYNNIYYVSSTSKLFSVQQQKQTSALLTFVSFTKMPRTLQCSICRKIVKDSQFRRARQKQTLDDFVCIRCKFTSRNSSNSTRTKRKVGPMDAYLASTSSSSTDNGILLSLNWLSTTILFINF